MNLTFPLCREPRHEDRIRSALDACVRFLVERLPRPAPGAIVLSGSFARGEGTVLALGGRLHVLGDLEFFVALPPGQNPRHWRRRFAVWSREASAGLAAAGVLADVEFGAVGHVFFARRARPSIFVHDLRRHGKVLWGRPDVLEEIPQFGPEDIPPEDALALLLNRIIEQLATYDRLGRLDAERLLHARYQALKLALDAAGSALAFAGMHTALYHRRPAAFARLQAETPSLAAVVPPGFASEVARAAGAKADPGVLLEEAAAGASPAARREAVRRSLLDAAPAVVAVLGWELSRLLERAGELPELLEAWLRRPSLAERARDWVRVVLHPMPAPLPIAHATIPRLLVRSTARALLHAAGVRAYLELAGLLADGGTVARMLPLPRRWHPRDAAARRRAVVALWTWCVRNH